MMKIRLILLYLFFSSILNAQIQNPPDILWKTINTNHFQVIFPDKIEIEAQRVANLLELAHQYDTVSLKVNPKKVPILLYTKSTIPNGYAALMPYRMVWFTTPPQPVTGLANADWMQTLALHEFRHIVQYNKNRQHFTKFMTYFFGDLGQLMMRWSIPDWFFEGDAICMETALSDAGRGRIPAFQMGIRTYKLNNIKFSYDQAYLGSYKRFYPDHYHLGYLLTAYGRTKYGRDIWNNVLERTSKISFWPYAFGTSIKKYTGKNVKKFYGEAMNSFDSVWRKENVAIVERTGNQLNKVKKRSWTSYFNPQFDEKGNIICGKESLDKIASFYKISPDGKEQKLKNTDATIFNYSNGKIIWARIRPDKRWGEQNFTQLMLYNLQKNKYAAILKKTKFLSPALSPDASKIAAVEFTDDLKCSLVLIDIESKKVTFRIKVGDNDYIRTPNWSKDGKKIVFTHAKDKGTALSYLEVETKKIKKILPYSWENIGRPVFYKNYILYNSPYSGIGNIYAVSIDGKENYQITNSKYGAYNASISFGLQKLAFQEFSDNGFNIHIMNLNPESWAKKEDVPVVAANYYKTLVQQEGGKSIFESEIPKQNYPVEKYKRNLSSMKLHSWGILPAYPSLMVFFNADNLLNTSSLYGAYLYNTNEKTHGALLRYSFSKFYPIFSIAEAYNQRSETYRFTNGSIIKDSWDEINSKLSANVPLNLSNGLFYSNISISSSLGYTRYFNKDVTANGGFFPLEAGFAYSGYRRTTAKDIYPRWGQYLRTNYVSIYPNDNYKGYQFSFRAGLYLPGIFRHHSLIIGGAYEKQQTFDPNEGLKIHYFSSRYSFPRGYSAFTLDKSYKFSADYYFPLWNPDISIGPLAYIKRIRMGAFIDWGKGYIANNFNDYQSVGGSLIFDLNLFRIRYKIELGIQLAYRLTDDQYFFSPLIFNLPF